MAYARSVGDKARGENKTNSFVSKLITKQPHLLVTVSGGWNRRAVAYFVLFRYNAFPAMLMLGELAGQLMKLLKYDFPPRRPRLRRDINDTAL